MSKNKKTDTISKPNDNKKLVKRFCYRFMWNNIKNESKYIKYMNTKLQIQIQPFYRDRQFVGKTKPQIIAILKQVPYFKFLSKKGKKVLTDSPQQPIRKIKIQYENAQRILLVTGINKDYLQDFLREYEKIKRVQLKTNYHGSWSSIELGNQQSALAVKKFLRSKKVTFDLQQNQEYRLPKRKVRIVLLNEDYFAILMDLVSQQANACFIKNFNSQPYLGHNYYPLHFEGKLTKKNELEQVIFYDDIASQQYISKSSEFYDHSRLNQIEVEMKSQGIQFEGGKQQQRQIVRGVQIQTESIQKIEGKNLAKDQQIQEVNYENSNKIKQQFEQKKDFSKKQEEIQSLIEKQNNSENSLKLQQIASDKQEKQALTINDLSMEDQKQILQIPISSNQKLSINSCQIAENNQIGVQVKQIDKTIKQSSMPNISQQYNTKTPSRKYYESHKNQQIILEAKAYDSSKKIKSNRKNFVSHHKMEQESMKKFLNKSLPLKDTYHGKKQQMLKPDELKSSPLTKIMFSNIQKNIDSDKEQVISLQQKHLVDIEEKKSVDVFDQENGNKVSQTRSLTVLQLNYATMKKKQKQYLKKIGRKQLEIPAYLKRPNDRQFFREKFYEQIIRHAAISRNNQKY